MTLRDKAEALINELDLPRGFLFLIRNDLFDIMFNSDISRDHDKILASYIPIKQILYIGNDPGFYLWLIDTPHTYSFSIIEIYQEYLFSQTLVGKELI